MITEKITEMLKKLIAKKTEVDMSDVIPEAEFVNDLGADSLAMFELFLSAEELFDNDIDFSDEEKEKIKKVQDFFDLIEEKIS